MKFKSGTTSLKHCIAGVWYTAAVVNPKSVNVSKINILWWNIFYDVIYLKAKYLNESIFKNISKPKMYKKLYSTFELAYSPFRQ